MVQIEPYVFREKMGSIGLQHGSLIHKLAAMTTNPTSYIMGGAEITSHRLFRPSGFPLSVSRSRIY